MNLIGIQGEPGLARGQPIEQPLNVAVAYATSPRGLVLGVGLVRVRPCMKLSYALGTFIGLSVFGSRNQAKDHRLRTVQ